MPNSVLVTGAAGFIVGHLVARLLADGNRVRVLDSLLPRVHGDDGVPPAYLSEEAELVVGDVRDPAVVADEEARVLALPAHHREARGPHLGPGAVPRKQPLPW